MVLALLRGNIFCELTRAVTAPRTRPPVPHSFTLFSFLPPLVLQELLALLRGTTSENQRALLSHPARAPRPPFLHPPSPPPP